MLGTQNIGGSRTRFEVRGRSLPAFGTDLDQRRGSRAAGPDLALASARARCKSLETGGRNRTGVGGFAGRDLNHSVTPPTCPANTVELDTETTEVLTEHLRRITAAVGEIDRDGFVFTNDSRGVQAWKPNWVTKAFQRSVRGAGVRSFRLHDLRHFRATEMLNAGVPIPIVSRRLDHRRISTTLDFYAHATPGGDRFSAEALRGKLSR